MSRRPTLTYSRSLADRMLDSHDLPPAVLAAYAERSHDSRRRIAPNPHLTPDTWMRCYTRNTDAHTAQFLVGRTDLTQQQISHCLNEVNERRVTVLGRLADANQLTASQQRTVLSRLNNERAVKFAARRNWTGLADVLQIGTDPETELPHIAQAPGDYDPADIATTIRRSVNMDPDTWGVSVAHLVAILLIHPQLLDNYLQTGQIRHLHAAAASGMLTTEQRDVAIGDLACFTSDDDAADALTTLWLDPATTDEQATQTLEVFKGSRSNNAQLLRRLADKLDVPRTGTPVADDTDHQVLQWIADHAAQYDTEGSHSLLHSWVGRLEQLPTNILQTHPALRNMVRGLKPVVADLRNLNTEHNFRPRALPALPKLHRNSPTWADTGADTKLVVADHSPYRRTLGTDKLAKVVAHLRQQLGDDLNAWDAALTLTSSEFNGTGAELAAAATTAVQT